MLSWPQQQQQQQQQPQDPPSQPPPEQDASPSDKPVNTAYQQERRAKNREAARASRQKKKAYASVLANTIASLSATVEGQRRELAVALARSAVSRRASGGLRFNSDVALRVHEYRLRALVVNVCPGYLRALAHCVSARLREEPHWDAPLVRKLQLTPEQRERVGLVLSSKLVHLDASATERARLETELAPGLARLQALYSQVYRGLAEREQAILRILGPEQMRALYKLDR